MSELESAQSNVDAVAEITAALQQAGLRVGDTEIASMVEGHLFVRQGLEVLRHRLPKTMEPALTFDGTAALRASGSGDASACC